MRRLFPMLLAATAWPMLALAAPRVPQLVESAIHALKSKSYDGRLRFMPDFHGGPEKEVRIYHLAPDLYRVEPLADGLPTSTYFIENAAQLVQVRQGDGVQELPDRQYSVTDALTGKFLRDLGTHPGTVLLDGVYHGVPIYVLRQDVTKEKPYLITVGLRQDNSFPIFLQVADAQGTVRLHNQFETIRFVKASDLKDALFQVPDTQTAAHAGPPRPAPAPSARMPAAPSRGSNAAGAAPEKGRTGPRGDPSESSDKGMSGLAASLPLYPEWLPQGYALDAISVLDYPGAAGVVYQFEVYGPRLDDMLSVFEMECSEFGDCNFGQALSPREGGYVMDKRDGWVVAAFGDLSLGELKKVLRHLAASHNDIVLQLLEETRQRDAMLEQATDFR